MTAQAQTRAPVIGGTRGLGLAIAERLAARGCRRIALDGRDRARGQAAAAALAARGLGAVVLPADAADAGAAGAPAGIRAAAANILAMVIRRGQSFLGPCAASQAALAKVAKNAAIVLGARRIRVNGIACGRMDTPGEDATQRRWHGAGDGWPAAAGARQPFGQLARPAGVAGLAAFMPFPAAGTMTGALADFDRNVAGACPE